MADFGKSNVKHEPPSTPEPPEPSKFQQGLALIPPWVRSTLKWIAGVVLTVILAKFLDGWWGYLSTQTAGLWEAVLNYPYARAIVASNLQVSNTRVVLLAILCVIIAAGEIWIAVQRKPTQAMRRRAVGNISAALMVLLVFLTIVEAQRQKSLSLAQSFKVNLTRASRFMTFEEERQLQSKFAAITTRQQHAEIMKGIRDVLTANTVQAYDE